MISVTVFLFLALTLIFSATGLECMIFVSSPDGINNTSCCTGGRLTPCATLDLALQGTVVQDNCSSGTFIYLSPGNYTLNTTALQEKQLLRNNVSIIGMRNGSRYEEVSISCLHVSSSPHYWLKFKFVNLLNCDSTLSNRFLPPQLQASSCNETNYTLKLNMGIGPTQSAQQICLNFTASTYCNQTKSKSPYYSLLYVCLDFSSLDPDLVFCDTIKPVNRHTYYILLLCDDEDDDSNITLSARIPGQSYSYEAKIQLIDKCNAVYFGACNYSNCGIDQKYCPISKVDIYSYVNNKYASTHYNNTCHDLKTGGLCTYCPPNYSVPINLVNTCISCDDCKCRTGLLVFIGINILPTTAMILIIIAFNIQLTNGFLNGLVFFSQMLSVAYQEMMMLDATNQKWLYVTPSNIFNLDFVSFLNKSHQLLCIAPNMSPLGAVSFWYVIGFYPLLLLLLLYVWIILYDKGFRCVVLITQPLHRCMARFWSMTGIEPSLTNSTASIYILCFTQIAAVSFRILRFRKLSHSDKSIHFFYDSNITYFHHEAGYFLASFTAIVILFVMIILPTLYIQLYPFRWFHKIMDCLHLRKQLLISLGDEFTGPYKNGSENSYDYRFVAGLYLLAKLAILSQLLAPFYYMIQITQGVCSFLLAITILIFRPFQKNIYNFCEVLMLALMLIISIATTEMIFFPGVDIKVSETHFLLSFIFNCLAFTFLLLCIIYWSFKMTQNCYNYYKQYRGTIHTEEEEDQPILGINDGDWTADRIENPQEYNEQHVPFNSNLDEQRPSNAEYPTVATCGSTNRSI